MEKTQNITDLLQDWNAGNQKALEKLFEVVQVRVKNLASSYLRQEQARSMQSSDLVNEAFTSLLNGKIPTWENRSHFFGIVARSMRQILIQHARKRSAQKRVDPDKLMAAEDYQLVAPRKPAEFLQLEEALLVLESVDPRQCRVVELRFFVGLSIKETAVALDCSEATGTRDWRLARAVPRTQGKESFMSPERWHRVKELFEEAGQKTGLERTAYLREIARDDQDLARELDSLLTASIDCIGFMEHPALIEEETPDGESSDSANSTPRQTRRPIMIAGALFALSLIVWLVWYLL